MNALRHVLLITLTIAAVPLFAADEMKKLDFLVGEWKGEAWYQMGPNAKREYALQHEKVTPKAGGNALMIEGLGRAKKEDGTAGELVHDAFAMLRWDDQAKQYRFSTAVAGRGTAEPKFEVTGPNKAVWSMTLPQGTMRYTITLNDKGEWYEVGEFSRDGEKWSKFLEMTLVKVK
jgi:hypothetical protein